MTNEDIINKIDNLKNGRTVQEIFDLLRPPEDFGDAVELTYDKDNESFNAIVFDPQTNTVYSEVAIKSEEDVRSFIKKTVK